MGFTTGFTGGVTLTLGVAYLAVAAHERNRQAQALALRSQSWLLNSLLEPTPLPPRQSRAELAREERSTLIETAKDRWNEEIENAVRWVQRTDWGEVREGMEGAVARLLGGGLQKSREGIEEVERQAPQKIQEAVGKSQAAAKQAGDRAAAGFVNAKSATVAGAERAGAEAREGAKSISASTKESLHQAGVKAGETRDTATTGAGRTLADVRAGAHEAAASIQNSGGTVDAARGALRNVVNKGIDKGLEALGKAQAAVGLTPDSKTTSPGSNDPSAVEKALQERYEKPNGLKRTAEEVLEERYRPIDSKDNTHLRGL